MILTKFSMKRILAVKIFVKFLRPYIMVLNSSIGIHHGHGSGVTVLGLLNMNILIGMGMFISST